MAASAVAVASLSRSHNRPPAAIVSSTPVSLTPIYRTLDAPRRLFDRVLAKMAFHNRREYRELIQRACDHVGEPKLSADSIRTIRRLDPQGLGIWILAGIQGQPRLADLCRHLIRSPGIGPPRVLARSLERALVGEHVCWFGAPDGFVALTAGSLITSALAASLAAVALLQPDGMQLWNPTLAHLTFIGNSIQATVSAFRRVFIRPFIAGDTAARLAVQAVNVIRRAMNRTDLMAVDEQLAHEAARLALTSAHAGCTAALELLDKPTDHAVKSAADFSREKLASIARTVDALASRLQAIHRPETPAATNALIEHAQKVIAQIPNALRPWTINLQEGSAAELSASTDPLSRRAVELALASSDILETWALLHELMLPAKSTGEITETNCRASKLAWAPRLVSSLACRWRSHEVIDALRQLNDSPDQSVSAASCIAALPHGSWRLHRDLWNLIRSSESSVLEKSLAFQLFWRLEAIRTR